MRINYWSALLAAVAIALVGCGKKTTASQAPVQVNGTAIDLPKLRAAFEGAPKDKNDHLNQIAFGIRYGDYTKALMEADALANMPDLTDAQKKATTEVLEQLKTLAAKAPPKPQ